MARQQALSSWLIVLPVMQAKTGAAAESKSKSATMLVRRFIRFLVYAAESSLKISCMAEREGGQTFYGAD